MKTPGCPKTGWEWKGAEDLHEDRGLEYGNYETCEYCGKEQIRYVHYLKHPDWKDVISVGRICANHLSGDPNVDHSEQRLRNKAQRKANFPKLKSWKVSAKGNEWIEYQDHHIVVIPWGKAYRLRIDGKFGKINFATPKEAKYKAFDVVMWKIHRRS